MFSERLSQFIDSIGKTPTSFEQIIGVSKGAILKAIRNKGTVGVETLEKIITNYPDLNVEWLITGHGSMLKDGVTQALRSMSANKHQPLPPAADPAVEYVAIRDQTIVGLVNTTAAVNWDGLFNNNEDDLIESIFYLPPSLLPNERNHLAFPVIGDGMEPTLPAKSIIIAELIKPDNYPAVGNNNIYLIITKDALLFRRVTNQLKEKGTLLLRSDNPEYASSEIRENQIASIWKAKSLFSSQFINESKTLHSHYRDLEERVALLEKKNVSGN